jgi:uncharacterized protein
MPFSESPLLTADVIQTLEAARRAGAAAAQCSLDLRRSTTQVEIQSECWIWNGMRYSYPKTHKAHTVYHWTEGQFQAVARFGTSLIKLVPTDWGPPTFEIDGIKMLPTAKISPYDDAERKVGLIQPRAKVILDCCGGLGYFAAWCLRGHARQILSFEKNADVLWLRSLNPWSPEPHAALSLTQADIAQAVKTLATASVDAVLHDPPRFAIAGDLYSQVFYEDLSRVMKRRGRMFHYTGTPNQASRGRDLAGEVSRRLTQTGFEARREGDGVLAIKQ